VSELGTLVKEPTRLVRLSANSNAEPPVDLRLRENVWVFARRKHV